MEHVHSVPPPDRELLPLFLRLGGRRVLVVGGGRMAAVRVEQLQRAGADVLVVAPEVGAGILERGVRVAQRPFAPSDLDGAWLVVAAATPAVNRAVGAEAERRRIFVNAVDDPGAATAYAGGVIRRGGVTVALSTDGRAPALAGLLREAIDALLPAQVGAWLERAEALRARWKAERVPMEARRPLLLQVLNELHGQATARAPAAPDPRPPAAGGHVALVGAGPGDPGLLTLKGRERLQEAELVLYDALVDPAVLALAPRARRCFVGKRAGRPSVRQEAIHRILIRAARSGRRVVRLKAGDPFVFGRGGEELQALAAAGVPAEVVPGVSAALAAPALAGIPVTHRGLAASFTVVSGHAEGAFRPVLASLPPGGTTVVVLMGVGTRARIAALLLDAGWSPATPVAAVFGASWASEARWLGTLGALGDAPLGATTEPGTLVIGEVAGLARTGAPLPGTPPAVQG